MWGGKLPNMWEPIDAEMYAILAYLRKMASASDAQSRRCLVLCDCKPALQQIENAHRKGMPEGLRDWERGGLLEAIAYYRSKLEAVVFKGRRALSLCPRTVFLAQQQCQRRRSCVAWRGAA